MKVRNTVVSALLAAVVMTASTGFAYSIAPVTAMAETNHSNGTITVNKATDNETYNVYQILKLESYNEAANAYAYKITAEWKGFADTAEAKAFFSLDSQDYVTWVGSTDDSSVQTFVRAALAYAKANNIQPTQTAIAANGTVSFGNLNYGYYAVDSSIGSLCMLDSTTPQMNINDKNEKTENEKLVWADGYGYQHMNDAHIGDEVVFKSTIAIKSEGPKSLSFHDQMEEGLTLDASSVTVTKEGSNKRLVPNKDYVLTTDTTDGCTFEIDFKQSYTDTLKAGNKLNVDYKATLNENAKVDGPNLNESHIKYGNKTTTTPSVTRTYTWSLDVFKYTNKDGEKALAGAEFVLKKADNDWKATGDAICFTQASDGVFRVDEKGDLSTLVTGESGKLNLVGLDSGNYLLEETKAPDGYNKLENAIKVQIEATPTNANAELASAVKVEDSNGKMTDAANRTVKVLNVTGSNLPSTGGMGTTVFYLVGTILVIGGGVVLVARKRASVINE
uniref:SpaH/EbpB family LPXTG-anchored major pilin n=1 Tax=Eubacterium cellulosolvens TaxID=29322 RepID=UPI0004819B62|nr:SpaH/EbpB family LPXTG-anchored major pilin [[Eubacterium] cellulosolvens]